MEAFRHQCLRTAPGLSRLRQQLEHLNNCELRRIWGDAELVSDIIRRRWLELLSHVVRMSDDRIPKQLCFDWLEKTRPPEGPYLGWKDCIADHLKRHGIPQNWCPLAQNRQAWRSAYSVALPSPPTRKVVLCLVCNRSLSPSGLGRL